MGRGDNGVRRVDCVVNVDANQTMDAVDRIRELGRPVIRQSIDSCVDHCRVSQVLDCNPPGSNNNSSCSRRYPRLGSSLPLIALPCQLDASFSRWAGYLSGTLPQISSFPRPCRHRTAQGLGFSGRWRDRRARIARSYWVSEPRETPQFDLRHQLQSAAARWSRPRQWQDYPGA